MKITQLSPVLMIFIITACGGNITGSQTALTATSAALNPGESEPAARIVFKKNNFTEIDDYNASFYLTGINTSHQCLGDVLKVFYADGDDYTGTPSVFPATSTPDTFSPTNRPIFIKNISVDITNTYYAITQTSVVATDSCSYRGISSAPNPSSCADFDRIPADPAVIPLPTVAPTATPSPAPAPSTTPTPASPGSGQYYGTGFYQVRDAWCTSQGPTISPDPEVTKSGVGGVSIDIDRTQLGAHEDLLMMVTYHALNANSGTGSWPATLIAGTAQSTDDETILKVNLVGTNQSLDTLLRIQQPRPWTYANTSAYPIYMKEIATLRDPNGSLRTEQVYIPLSQNGLIDRIRIDRVRGSFHLFQIDLYRLGNRAE